MNFDYLAEKINKAKMLHEPFEHIYIYRIFLILLILKKSYPHQKLMLNMQKTMNL